MKIVCDFLNMDGSVIKVDVEVSSAFEAREKAKQIASRDGKAVRYRVYESKDRVAISRIDKTMRITGTDRRCLVDTIIHPEVG